MMQRDNRYIAFVCSGNTCRSPMAEEIFNKLSSEKGLCVNAESFGMQTVNGLPISENSIAVCREIDVDLTELKSCSIREADLNKYEKFYCMSPFHAMSLNIDFGVPKNKIEIMNVSDPYGGDENIYRQCRNQIYDFVSRLIKEYDN